MSHGMAEAFLICGAILIYIGYHVWLFYSHDNNSPDRKAGVPLFSQGRVARICFTDMICKENDTIAGIQQNRNVLTGIGFLAAIASVLAQKVMSILLDQESLDQIARYGRTDPIAGQTVVPATTILGFTFLVIMLAVLALVHTVRMCVHAGYFFKAGALDPPILSIDEVAKVTLQAHVAQTVGLRLLMFFPVAVSWLIGPTAMLATAFATTAFVAWTDFYTCGVDYHRGTVIDIQEKLMSLP
eukprot:jgi/Ulvmu1/8801/UM048_0056.1